MDDLVTATNCLATLQAAKTEAEKERTSSYKMDNALESVAELVQALALKYKKEATEQTA